MITNRGVTTDKATIGVIVGRFQVPSLTQGHRAILDHVLAQEHHINILVLGTPPPDVRSTKNNPIPFRARRHMIEEAYPGKFEILYIQDARSDVEWSQQLDKLILNVTDGNRDVVLYGSRDSFMAHYYGPFNCVEYRQRVFVSGTHTRQTVGQLIGTTEEFRNGCVYATQNSHTAMFPTVDCAIFTDLKWTHLYMGKKQGSQLFRFPGGFVDPTLDSSYEGAALREAKEETGLDCINVRYVGSMVIPDWRYAGETEGIMTTLFTMRPETPGATPTAGDDLAEVHIMALNDLKGDAVVPEHRELLHRLKQSVARKTTNGKEVK